jgi:N-carbamoylputrescine amidase
MNIEDADMPTTDASAARSSPVRVVVVQFDPQAGLENRDANLASVRRRLELAVSEGANLIVLPELATSGYCFRSREEAYAHAEVVPTGPTVKSWEEFAKTRGIHLVGCLPELEGVKLFDTAVLVGPEGFIGRYRKTHLWNKEKLFFEPGDLGYPVFETRLGRIGLLVCWDIWFPEAARILVQQGADIICVPTGWVWTPPPLYDATGTCMAAYLTMATAHANAVFIATADRIGKERDTAFMGNSLIADTSGWPIGRIAGATEDTLLYADIDLASARSAPIWNQLNDLHRDRRVDLYDHMLGYRGGKPLPR